MNSIAVKSRFEIENLCPPFKSGGVGLLHFRLNINQQIGLGLHRRLCPGSDDAVPGKWPFGDRSAKAQPGQLRYMAGGE